MEPVKEKLAAFITNYGTTIISIEWAENDPNYTRISDYVVVEFPPLANEEVLKNQIATIDKKIETVKQESIDLINQLQQKKQELLALEHTND